MSLSHGPAADRLHRLVVEADADANVLLRLLEPFVIHNVLPCALASVVQGEVLAVTLDFVADEDLAERLAQRVGAMVPVRAASRTRLAHGFDAAA